MPVTEQDINNATPEQRQTLRAQAIAESDDRPTFTRGEFTLTAVEGPTIVGNAIEVRATLTRNGQPVNIDGHYLFINPPTKVQTGVDVDGKPVYEFRPRQAFRDILFDAVRDDYLRRNP